MVKNIEVSPLLAHNIRMTREDIDFRNSEKASVADALHGIAMAKAELEENKQALEKLDIATEVIMSYLFHIDLFAEE